MTRDLETKLDQAYRATVVVAVAMVASVLMKRSSRSVVTSGRNSKKTLGRGHIEIGIER